MVILPKLGTSPQGDSTRGLPTQAAPSIGDVTMNYLNTNGHAAKAPMMRFGAALWLILYCAGIVSAQTTAFTYQGRLTDAGNPASGNYDLQFKLFDALAGGAQQGATLVRTPVPVSAGNFTVTLDFGAVVFSGADRFLEIAVRPAGSGNAYTVLSPRQPITPTPYAIRSMNSTQLGGVDASQYVTTSTVGSAFIKNDTALQSGANFNISGNGFVGGNVGIGTTSPLSKLTVQATGYGLLQSSGPAVDAVKVGTFVTTAAGGSAWFGTKSNHPLNFFTNDGLPQMTIDTSGNVGIGVSPTTKLHVLNTTVGTSAIFGESATGPGVYGKSTSSRGVYGESNSFIGVWGKSTTNSGVFGETAVSSLTAGGVYGKGTGSGSIGVIGESNLGFAVGVFGVSGSPDGYGGYFRNTGGGNALIAEGTARVGVLEIYGGSDLAEKFEVTDETKPGMVVAIDPERPGKLSVSRGAYNRRVAGIISGANNLSAGMVLPNLADAKTVSTLPVALTGRVWVYCDATKNAIHPGDLLTTAATPGYAMKVLNHARAQGAIIGKAMTELKSGRGLVLVLVSLQ